MRQSKPSTGPEISQRGVALVISLLLLLVLAILAVAGLRTATADLTMAGNQQYQDHAFQAAELGVEQALNSALCTQCTYSTPVVVAATQVAGSQIDKFNYSFYYAGSSSVPVGNSLDPDSGNGTAYNYVVESTGTSARGARDVHVQGFTYIGPSQ
jgi:type IV pilus assembly protein PilX